MANFKRFFLFTVIRALMRISWQGQRVRMQDGEIGRLNQELQRTRGEALTLARVVEEECRPIRDELEAKHSVAIAGLLSQLRIGTDARILLAREVIAKNREIESRDQEIARLAEVAVTDPLTGLYNRRGASEALHRLLRVFERQNQRAVGTGSRAEVHDLSVLAFDLNHFKLVNDRFGHAAGDVVLAIIAEHIKRAFRAEDVLIRPGGDEFKAYLVNATRDGAIARAETLSALMLADDRLQFDDIRVTVSIGISHGRFTTRRGGLQIMETLEQLADTAMYAAKNGSRDVSGITIAPDAISSDTVLGDL
jgi:diguanylate cyclase (GGDEF)-like protein